jgi:GT2 family glycosyltransferase
VNNPLLIIPTYFSSEKHVKVFEECITTIRNTTNAEIICVDDCSPDDELYEKARAVTYTYANIDLVQNRENSGFAKTVNVGLRRALKEKRDAVLVNQDMEFREEGWLEQAASHDADIVGGLLLYPNGLIQHAGIYFSTISRAFVHRFGMCFPKVPAALRIAECPVTGALQYIKYETLEKFGIYDEKFFLGYEDVDYNLRVLLGGGKCLYDPRVIAIHHESIIRKDYKNHMQVESLRRIMEKYRGVDFSGLVPSSMEPNKNG